ncbi:MAG: M28 family peptidase, partial [Mucilaginibacter sp.]
MKIKLTILLLFVAGISSAQDSVFSRKMVDTLASPYFWGRGYTKNGAAKAATFLTEQLQSYGVSPMDGKNFIQPFSYPVNTYPGKMEVAINGVQLMPGRDFIIRPDSRGVKGTGELIQRDSVTFVDTVNRILVILENKLTWSAEQRVVDFTVVELDKKLQKTLPVSIKVNVENEMVSDFKTGNICGIVKGTSKPDSLIVFTAHYDHLGGMGSDTYFPGANDNASGVTQILSLAKYYAAHPQPYSMAFILFAGEEAGLVGSKYFTENPLVPLKNIRFLINLDLEGTGIEGITVVNATLHANEFSLLKQINEKNHYLAKVASRGKAANSDHYFFTEKGVPAFFMYTLGGIKAYHDIYDISATLPLTEYKNLFNLLLKFSDALMGKGAYSYAQDKIDVAALPGKGLAQHDFLLSGEWDYRKPVQTIYLVRKGQVVWTYEIPTKEPSGNTTELGDATMRPNGNIVFCRKTGASEVNPDKKIVWNFDAVAGTEVHSVQPIANDKVLMVVNGVPAKVMLINVRTGKTENEFTIPTGKPGAHLQFRRVRTTPDGNIIAAHLDSNAVAEYDMQGKLLWSYTVRKPYSVSRLKNG